MLDYVYANRAGGRGPLGRLVDRVYLDGPGWRGIRERRANLVRTLSAIVLTRWRSNAGISTPTRFCSVTRWLPSAASRARSGVAHAVALDRDARIVCQAAGFVDVQTHADTQGIFSVSVMRAP